MKAHEVYRQIREKSVEVGEALSAIVAMRCGCGHKEHST